MHYTYKTQGTCAKEIEFDINDGVVTNVHFVGGCPGNLSAIPILVEGMSADEIDKKLKDVKCGFKNTSCAGQLAKAVEEAVLEERGLQRGCNQ